MAEVKQYRCDICGKVEPWGPGWIQVLYMISRKLMWEHDFHVCSQTCEQKLEALSKPERKKLAWEAGKEK